MTTKAAENRYGIPILLKGFEILEFISLQEQGATLAELVSELNCPKTSTYRILCSFEHMGYLRKNPVSGRFSLTPRIVGLAISTLGNTSILELSYETMLKLRDGVRETVLMGIPVGNKIVALEQVLGSHQFAFTLRPGTKVDLHASAPGKVVMAFCDEMERERMLQSIDYKIYNENTIANRQAMEVELAQIRECGYALDRGEDMAGVRCIATPVFNHSGKVVAALWITGPEGRLNKDVIAQIAPAVMAASDEISKKIGYER